MLKMYAELEGKLNGQSFKEYNQGLSFGGFCFRCMINGEDKSVNFDWDSCVGKFQDDGTFLLMEGEDAFLKSTEELDTIYDAEYEKEGFSRSDLTAKILAETSEIEEFVVDYDLEEDKSNDDFIHIQSITFVDDTGSYCVSGDVLDRFNGLEIYEPIRAEGDVNSYDEFIGDYPDESDLSYAMNCPEYDDMEEELPF